MDSAPRPIAISFDLWGTLIGSHPDFKAHRNELLRRRLAPDVSPELFTATLRAADRAADEDSMASGADIGCLPRIESALHRLGVRTTISPADAEEMEAEEREILAALGIDDPYRLQQVVRRRTGKWVNDTHRRRPMIIPVVIQA